ncbi:hypothetical protein [Micromonospora sp. WMMD1082]|nr:hypothetical protein [Micromonospora sp. WMMD1082]MDG4798681.1 hypothetical protein [Micromonospora sp. WMMD1082]
MQGDGAAAGTGVPFLVADAATPVGAGPSAGGVPLAGRHAERLAEVYR